MKTSSSCSLHGAHFALFGPAFRGRRGAFTLLQILVVVGLISLLAAILIGQFGRSRASVSRVQCDVHLKSIVMALDTYRQETGHFPANLRELSKKDYLPIDILCCPSDPDLGAKSAEATYASYENFYVQRDALDSAELPIGVCPFHEKEGEHGVQGFKGASTKAFASRPAVLSGAMGTVTVTRPGVGVVPIPASGELAVRGADRIQVGVGKATLSFADGSSAELGKSSEMSVLESYMESQNSGSIYTLVRQFAGTISYSVSPGNRFDVATPTATAGALGTRFTVQIVDALPNARPAVEGSNIAISAPKESILTVTQHTVAFTCQGRTINISETDPPVRSDAPGNANRKHTPRNSQRIIVPTATAKPSIPDDEQENDKDKDKDKDKGKDGDDKNNGGGNG